MKYTNQTKIINPFKEVNRWNDKIIKDEDKKMSLWKRIKQTISKIL